MQGSLVPRPLFITKVVWEWD